jgi:hypothetical protein
MIIGIFKSKSLAIVGSPRDFIITDKKKEDD